jgi:hypothetical protein
VEAIRRTQLTQTPLSDHLCEVLCTWGESFAGLTSDFELLFERYELLSSLAALESIPEAELEKLLSGTPQDFVFMPVGRVAWDSQRRSRLTGELSSGETRDALLKAGFGRGSAKLIELFVTNSKRVSRRIS